MLKLCTLLTSGILLEDNNSKHIPHGYSSRKFESADRLGKACNALPAELCFFVKLRQPLRPGGLALTQLEHASRILQEGGCRAQQDAQRTAAAADPSAAVKWGTCLEPVPQLLIEMELCAMYSLSTQHITSET